MHASKKPLFLKRVRRGLLMVFMILLSGCGPDGLNRPGSAETPTILPPTRTPTVTATPTITLKPTATATPTITPTPIGGSANLVYAYFSMDGDDPEIATAFLNIVQFGESISLPIDTQFTPPSWIPDILFSPEIAISPDASRVVAVVNTEDGSELIEVDLQASSPSAQFLTALPTNELVTSVGFSPSGNWLYVSYSVGARDYVGFLEVGTDKFNISYECRFLIDILTDDSVVCRISQNVGDIGMFNLGQFSMDESYLNIPNSRIFSETKLNWNFKDIVPSINSFVLEREDGKFFLISELDYYGLLSYWSSEDIDNVINSPVVAELPRGAYVFQFLPSPDKERIAVIGINSRGLGGGPGIDSRTFTFVTDLDETYQPKDPEKPGTTFYPLRWSPDSRALVGLSHCGSNLSIWDTKTGEFEILYTNSDQPFIYFWNTEIFGIAVEWLDD